MNIVRKHLTRRMVTIDELKQIENEGVRAAWLRLYHALPDFITMQTTRKANLPVKYSVELHCCADHLLDVDVERYGDHKYTYGSTSYNDCCAGNPKSVVKMAMAWMKRNAATRERNAQDKATVAHIRSLYDSMFAIHPNVEIDETFGYVDYTYKGWKIEIQKDKETMAFVIRFEGHEMNANKATRMWNIAVLG